MASHQSSLDRRQVLRWLGAAASGLAVAGCAGTSQRGTPEGGLDLGEARLSAIMRGTFIPALEEQAKQRSDRWSQDRNAEVVLRFSPEWRTQYESVAQARQGDDLAELFGIAPIAFAEELVDVTELAEALEERHGAWMGAAKQAAMVDGRWRALPWAFTGLALNYRVDVLHAAGSPIPRTYESLLECATLLSDNSLPPLGLSMNKAAPNDSASLAYSMLWSFGAAEVDATGRRVALDSDATRNALSMWAELASTSGPEAATFDEGGNNAAFIDGRISLTQNAPSIYWSALKDHPAIAENMSHARYPEGPAGFHQLVEVNSLGVFRHSRNADAALDWIEAMTAEDFLRERASLSLAFFSPPMESFVEDPDMPWNADPKLAAMKEIPAGAHTPGWPGPATIESVLVYDNRTIVDMFQAVSSKEMSVDAAVRAAADDLRRVYET